MKSKHLATILTFFSALNLWSQGQFITRTIQSIDPLLEGNPIHLYLYLPDNFDETASHKLIVGIHGLGNPNSSEQIRQYLAPVANQIGAIVACPDPYLNDQPKSVAVVNQAVDSLSAWYNIDPIQKYIVGYSAGSDIAARYVLNLEKHKFKGLVWFAPGFYSITSVPNADKIPPICLCVGTFDLVSLAQANIINLALNNSTVPHLYNTISGVGHTMQFATFPQEMIKCINFIDENNQTSLIELSKKPSVRFFPNPTVDILQIESGELGASFRIFNQDGKIVDIGVVQNAQIDVSKLKSGTYFLELNTRKAIVQQKFLKY